MIAVKHTAMLGTPKRAKGRRTVTLDSGTVAALREHRKRQAAERLLMGAGWTDNDLVFCHVDGTMLHPERFTRGFSEAVRRLGLPAVRLHDLRHGWATLAGDVHPVVVAARSNHAQYLRKAGEVDEAIKLYKDELDRREANFGEKGYRTSISRLNLAIAL